MLASIATCAIDGIDARLVHVEVDVAFVGLTYFAIVGLPDAAVKESGERVKSAIRNTGLTFPWHRTIINLAPADLRKAGPGYDLPIAVGVLVASEQIAPANAEGALFVGELALDGSVRHVRGVLPMAAFARLHGFRTLFVPRADADEAALIPGIDVIPVGNLLELVDHLSRHQPLAPHTVPASAGDAPGEHTNGASDFADVRGQEHARRALEVAAAGNHNCLMSGPPGSGKTLLARSLASILPALSVDEALEVTRIYSVADLLPRGQPLIRRRPFRAPHHTISQAGLVGGGSHPRPGEISLAHRGVLFLDELPEFGRHALEALRQPLEAERTITLARANATHDYPANFMLVAACNPCPCGYRGDPTRPCLCSDASLAQYRKRVSGPLLDRIDIHLDVPRVDYDKLAADRPAEPSSAIRARVAAARECQRRRAERRAGNGVATNGVPANGVPANGVSPVHWNADLTPPEIRQYCALDDAGRTLMRSAMQQLGLSARGFHRVLKVARTIADLADSERVLAVHVAEAVQYRPRGMWG